MMQRRFTVRATTWRDDQAALQSVRTAVFVVEQKIDPREEFDDVDLICDHILAVDELGIPIGTGRVDERGKIGRMAVLADWRKSGVGRALLRKALDLARLKDHKRVYLHAQVAARGFYEREGFVPYGDRFDEAGIEHLAMQRFL
jgi:predicted GNAT family N-acyltransferase